jgi:hypothetical protein
MTSPSLQMQFADRMDLKRRVSPTLVTNGPGQVETERGKKDVIGSEESKDYVDARLALGFWSCSTVPLL